MPTTTTYGYKKPINGERGSVFYPALNDNFQRLNDHTHDGVNSAPIPAANITKGSASILAASWVSLGGGNYRQLVTTPSGVTVDNMIPKFFCTGGAEDGHQILPSIEKVSSTTYYVYINDNTQTLTVKYG